MTTKQRKMLISVTAAAMTLGLSALPASARDGDVIVRGDCTQTSTAKLKLGPRADDGITEVEFEVDQNVNGEVWRVVLKDNGERFHRRRYTTAAPSGSFSVERTVAGASDHRIVARAVNLGDGEVCRLVARV
jgi:hypothetical protein